MEIVLWICGCIAIGWWASNWHRSGVGFGLLALVASPVVGAIVLAVVGKGRELDPVTGNPVAWKYTKCPHCAEQILVEAKICKHCHSAVDA